MAPSSKYKHRFQNSLDMVAARSVFVDLTQPSGTDNAWSTLDSPTLGRMWSASMLPAMPLERSTPQIPTLSVSVAPLQTRKAKPAPIDLSKIPEVKQVDTTPLNIKKMRRRGFSTSLRLVLPPSPLPPPRSPLGIPSLSSSPSSPLPPPRSPFGLSTTSTPQTALTFTAEWDLTQRTFVFTPFQSTYSPSIISPMPSVSPVPDDVPSEVVPESQSNPDVNKKFPPPASPTSPLDSPSIYSPSVSSVFSHHRNGSQSTSTAPSSAAADISSKSDVYSSSLSRQVALHLFTQELQRAIPGPKCDLDKECYEDMDEDLLMAPVDVFSRMLWESTDPEAPVTQPEPVEMSRLLPAERKRQLKVTTCVSPSPKSKATSPEEIANPSPRKGSPRTRKKRKFSQDLVVGGRLSLKV